jgi:4'-phosphopantetheinyl transferase
MTAAEIWIVSIPEDDNDLGRALSILTPDERRRAARLRHDADRRSYVYGHAALRVLLGATQGAPAEARPFSAGPHGKPFIAGAPHFSVSRAGARAAIGLCVDGEVGVDIERVERGADSIGIGESRFTAAERAWLDHSSGSDERLQRYLRLWVIREALLKAQGVGLPRTLTDGDIAIENDEPLLPETSEWRIFEPPASLKCVRGFVAAAAVPRGCEVVWRCIGCREIIG